MLIAVRGTVTQIKQLTSTGFAEVSLTGSLKIIGGNVLAGLKKDDAIIVVGKDETSPKYGPQVKALRWWFEKSCPFTDVEGAKKAISHLYDELKLPPKMGERIFDAYLDMAEEVIRDNPYRLVTEGKVKRLSVNDIDKYIAPHFQIAKTDRRRLKAEIIYNLRKARSLNGLSPYVDEATGESYGHDGGGHIYLDFKQLAFTCAEEMSLDRKTVANEVRALASTPRNPLDLRPLITIDKDAEGNDSYVYPYTLHMAERGLAAHINRLRKVPISEYLATVPISSRVDLSEEQAAAVRMALSEAISIVTGGPGVGKTTIISALTDTLTKSCIAFSLCAPTGVAARRIVRSTNEPASTIHRLLKVNPIQGRFEHNRAMPLQADVIICDESSMIDLALMYSLFDAIKTGARVVLVGDADQLPPVGAGSPFRDLVGWGKLPTTRLTRIYRQELVDSLIIQGSRDILAKKVPEFSKDIEKGDLFVFPYTNEMRAIRIIEELVTEKIPKRFGISSAGVQVLSPHKRKYQKGKKKEDENASFKLLSAENLNEVIQKKMFGTPPEGQRFFVGDRVIHTRNNYNLDVMNGEIGFVREAKVKEHKKVKRVEYLVEYEDEKKVAYDDTDSKQLDLAYALSVHKAQGTESPAVIVLAYHSGKFFSRNMLYTAVTRGKRVVIIVSPQGSVSFQKILRTNETLRNSRLIHRIEIGDDPEHALEQLNLDDLSDGEEA